MRRAHTRMTNKLETNFNKSHRVLNYSSPLCMNVDISCHIIRISLQFLRALILDFSFVYAMNATWMD